MSSAPATRQTLRELWPAIEAALAWIDGPGDRDKDGFVEYFRQTDKGLANQGWKDSHDAIFHADGRMATGPIALAEVQGYVFAAKQLAARCAERLGHAELARKLEAEAARLAERFDEAFWCPEIETYALALDGDKQPCRVRTSNAGQVLFSGIARPDRASLVADGLINPRFFSGWGIRTVARGEVRYNPMSYHNGSIWPHDNALIALGLGALRVEAPGRADHPGPVRGRDLHGPAAPAGTLLRVPARAPARTDALSGRLRAAGLGECDGLLADRGVARARVPSGHERNLPAQSATPAVPRRSDPAQSAGRRFRRPI